MIRMSKKIRSLLFLCIAFAISTPSHAAVDMFLGIFDSDGVSPFIMGEAQDSAHQGEIDVLAWHWKTVSQNGATCVDGLSITKYIDLSSAEFLITQLEGQFLPVGRLVVRQAGSVPFEFLTLEFTNLVVSSIETGGDGGQDRLLEVIHFTFDSLTYTYLPQRSDGSAGSAVTATGANLKFNC